MGLKEKNVLLGVSGGIAVYKAVELVRSLRREKANVEVILTEAAAEFISPIVFQTLSGRPVRTQLFDKSSVEAPHIACAQWADIICVVPATANILGKVAAGIADDLLSTTIMAASSKPVVFAPAMNSNMYHNPVVQRNIGFLRDLGFSFVGPTAGELACGTSGTGRLSGTHEILAALECVLSKKDLAGLKILITAGGTREPIDPVRFISNRSSGKTGYALARAAWERGGEVTLVAGPTCLEPPPGVETVVVESADEMYTACNRRFGESDIVIMSAAVSDFTPVDLEPQKIKKEAFRTAIPVKPTRDILKELGQTKRSQFLVGFCAETEDLESRAAEKKESKNLDLIVANDVSKGIFGSDETSIVLLDSRGKDRRYDAIPKSEAANLILDAVVEGLAARDGR